MYVYMCEYIRWPYEQIADVPIYIRRWICFKHVPKILPSWVKIFEGRHFYKT